MVAQEIITKEGVDLFHEKLKSEFQIQGTAIDTLLNDYTTNFDKIATEDNQEVTALINKYPTTQEKTNGLASATSELALSLIGALTKANVMQDAIFKILTIANKTEKINTPDLEETYRIRFTPGSYDTADALRLPTITKAAKDNNIQLTLQVSGQFAGYIARSQTPKREILSEILDIDEGKIEKIDNYPKHFRVDALDEKKISFIQRRCDEENPDDPIEHKMDEKNQLVISPKNREQLDIMEKILFLVSPRDQKELPAKEFIDAYEIIRFRELTKA